MGWGMHSGKHTRKACNGDHPRQPKRNKQQMNQKSQVKSSTRSPTKLKACGRSEKQSPRSSSAPSVGIAWACKERFAGGVWAAACSRMQRYRSRITRITIIVNWSWRTHETLGKQILPNCLLLAFFGAHHPTSAAEGAGLEALTSSRLSSRL